jgi:peptidoglycan/xylan/chitin deacetylase (PgdA/CDA1 family)
MGFSLTPLSARAALPTLILIASLMCAAAFAATRSASAVARAPITSFVPMLLMHHVKATRPTDDTIERGLTISPAQFSSEMRYLVRNHFHTITATQLASYLRGGKSLPSKPVVLSFDDGYVDVYEHVFYPLSRLHMTATFFIVPGFLGMPRYLSWAEVKDMATHGMDIESHTMSHPDLTTVNAQRQWSEVNGSRSLLQRKLHRTVRLFAYPYGAYNQSVLSTVARAGYWAAFTTRQGWIQSSSRLLTLPRVYIDNDDTLRIFAGRLAADPAVLAEDPT